jgi:hypothetical protein
MWNLRRYARSVDHLLSKSQMFWQEKCARLRKNKEENGSQNSSGCICISSRDIVLFGEIELVVKSIPEGSIVVGRFLLDKNSTFKRWRRKNKSSLLGNKHKLCFLLTFTSCSEVLVMFNQLRFSTTVHPSFTSKSMLILKQCKPKLLRMKSSQTPIFNILNEHISKICNHFAAFSSCCPLPHLLLRWKGDTGPSSPS